MNKFLSFSELMKESVKFISTGCTLLDLALGGGFVRGRVVNLVGEESAGKTLLAVNVGRECNKDGGYFMFDDCEGTLDIHRAVKVFEVDSERSFYVQSRTVEKLYGNLLKFCKFVSDNGGFGLYVLDSLDAVHTRMSAEAIEKIMNEAKSRGKEVEELDLSMREKLDKSALMSWLFSVIVGILKDFDVCFVVISQVREKPGVVFGDKYDVSGGRALKFYSSQRVWLKDVEKIKSKEGEIIGIWVEGIVKKNKVAPPFRRVLFPVLFNSGVDDLWSMINYLKEEGVIEGRKWGDKGFRSEKEMIEWLRNEEMIDKVKLLVKETWERKNEV